MFEYDQDIVKSLLNESNDFKKLYEEHGVLDEQITEAYNQPDQFDDLIIGTLKKEKLYLKDKMAAMVEDYRQTQSG